MRLPLYTSIEVMTGYFDASKYQHSKTQIACTYVFAWMGVFLSVATTWWTSHLVHKFQIFHSSNLLVHDYDQQMSVSVSESKDKYQH